MKDENGKELSEKEIIHEILSQLSNICCFAFELESDQGQSFAWLIDSAIKYGTIIYNGDNVLLAACDFAKYEESLYNEDSK